MRLPGGFIAGVEERFGFTAILGAKTFLFAGVGVLDVERAAEFSAIENIPAFHNSDFFSPRLRICPWPVVYPLHQTGCESRFHQ